MVALGAMTVSGVHRFTALCIFIFMALLFFILDFILSIIQGFNCADLRNVCTEAGMFAIRAMREYVTQEDFMKVPLKPA